MGAHRPKVSVLVLNYNYARFLPEALESVLAQDIPPEDMEILVIDDGSTDGSREAVRPYLGNVRWLGKENGGQISAFNLGFEEARGEFLAILEADDLWKKSKLRRCLERLEAEPRGVLVQHWLLQADAQSLPLPGYFYPAFSDHYGFSDVIWGRIPLAGTSAIVCRKERIRPFMPLPPLLFGADICLRVAASANAPLLNIPEILGVRRIHGNNLFGETVYDEPAKVARAVTVHRGLTAFTRGVMAKEGLPPDPAFFRREEIDICQEELFAARYRGEIREALRACARALRTSGWRGYTVFKGATLLLALLSPTIYVSLQQNYARLLRSRALSG